MGELTPSQNDISSQKTEWHIIQVKTRVESLNHLELGKEIRALMAEGHKKIALDLKANHFMSLLAINACVEAARDLANDGGSFALISCPERVKWHFEIYGSLANVQMCRTDRELSA